MSNAGHGKALLASVVRAALRGGVYRGPWSEYAPVWLRRMAIRSSLRIGRLLVSSWLGQVG
jgi:hypothetical protein